jgi:ketosteroid isomerase-like protein
MFIMAMVAMLAPMGCSLGGDEEPQPVSGVPKEIAATVEQLERAVATRDFAEVCDELFTKAARERSGGADCAKQLSVAAEGVRRPRIQVAGITVEGDKAVVTVVTRAEGQARVSDELRLRREGGRWRVESLG